MASKKHYVAVAKEIADEIRSARTWLVEDDDAQLVAAAHARIQTANRIARAIGSVFVQGNANFSMQQFLTACGVE